MSMVVLKTAKTDARKFWHQ